MSLACELGPVLCLQVEKPKHDGYPLKHDTYNQRGSTGQTEDLPIDELGKMTKSSTKPSVMRPGMSCVSMVMLGVSASRDHESRQAADYDVRWMDTGLDSQDELFDNLISVAPPRTRSAVSPPSPPRLGSTCVGRQQLTGTSRYRSDQ